MLSRRILRDTKERGRDVDGIIAQYLRFVKRSYDTFVLPSSKHADIIVPGQDNDTAKVLLAAHVQREIDARSLRFRSKLMEQNAPRSRQTTAQDMEVSEEQEPFFTLLKQTNQLQVSSNCRRNMVNPYLTPGPLGNHDNPAGRFYAPLRVHLLCRWVPFLHLTCNNVLTLIDYVRLYRSPIVISSRRSSGNARIRLGQGHHTAWRLGFGDDNVAESESAGTEVVCLPAQTNPMHFSRSLAYAFRDRKLRFLS